VQDKIYYIYILNKIQAGLCFFALGYMVINAHAFIYQTENHHLHIACQDQGMTKWDR
jgi:hypothetical protein